MKTSWVSQAGPAGVDLWELVPLRLSSQSEFLS